MSDRTDGRWRIARKVAPDRVITVVDPEARHAHKTVHRRQDGFKAHIAVEPETGIMTDCAWQGLRRGHQRRDRRHRPAHTRRAREVLGDAAYGSGESRANSPRRAHRDHQADPAAPAGAGGFTIDDFTSTTPPGLRPARPGVARHDQPHGTATFGVACRDCPLRARCTTAQGRQSPARPRARPTATRSPPARRDRTFHKPTGNNGRWSNGPSPGSTRRQPQSPLPRGHQERPVAPPPHRRPQPAPAARPRPPRPQRDLGPGLTGQRRRAPAGRPQPPYRQTRRGRAASRPALRHTSAHHATPQGR